MLQAVVDVVGVPNKSFLGIRIRLLLPVPKWTPPTSTSIHQASNSSSHGPPSSHLRLSTVPFNRPKRQGPPRSHRIFCNSGRRTSQGRLPLPPHIPPKPQHLSRLPTPPNRTTNTRRMGPQLLQLPMVCSFHPERLFLAECSCDAAGNSIPTTFYAVPYYFSSSGSLNTGSLPISQYSSLSGATGQTPLSSAASSNSSTPVPAPQPQMHVQQPHSQVNQPAPSQQPQHLQLGNQGSQMQTSSLSRNNSSQMTIE